MEKNMSEVNLIALSKPSAITDCRTAADLIAYTARVSNPANQSNLETAPRLLRYLIKENHWSPFEMVHMTLEIKTTRDIARQILRHRSFSFQEFSQRYAVAPGFENREARLQDTKNRQNSVETDDRDLNEWWSMQQKHVQNTAELAYNEALDKGIAKEQARALLPEGLTQSTLYMAGSLRSWVHYCDLRRGNGTQKEHAEIADKCWEIIGVHFPDIVKALEEE
ncbi:FAD-dependent thymidylate synthase [bacterium]|nr:FAD-dependent thymidylate synthase [bacterium]